MTDLIDTENRATWPAALQAIVGELADQQHGPRPDCASDLQFGIEHDAAVLQACAGTPVAGYHCTRLRDAEVSDILQEGLRPASAELLERKLCAAVAAGELDPAAAASVSADTVLRRLRHARGGRVCVTVVRSALDTDVRGFLRLLTRWGGEISYHAFRDDSDESQTLSMIGRPAIVAVAVPTSAEYRVRWWPSLSTVLLGTWLKVDHLGGEAHLLAGEAARLPVLDVWRSGDPEYDRHGRLPRC